MCMIHALKCLNSVFKARKYLTAFDGLDLKQSIDKATEILKTNDPTSLPQWQLHGSVLVVNNEIKQVMIKVDRYKEPTIVVPKPYIVR